MDAEARMDTEGKKVLSQREIDLLLGALGSQEGQQAGAQPEVGRNVRPYDFRRPDKFSKEHLRALQTIHESFARAAGFSLSSYLRTGVQLRLTSIEQIVYGEYIQQLPNPTVVNVASADPLPGRMIVEMNLDLGFAFVDRLLGGAGHIENKIREVTDIELALLQTLAKNLLGALRETWLQLSPVTLNSEDVVFNPQVVQAAFPSDVGVLLLFELRMGEVSGTISMFIPYTMLEPVMGKLSSQVWFAGINREMVEAHDEIRKQIENVALPITVNLGTATVSTRDLLGLQKGNVIKLDNSSDQEVHVFVGGKLKFFAKPGKVGRMLAVKVTRVLREERPRKKTQVVEPAVGGAARA